jgi:predicted protein tyrosine phosphatase
VGLEGEPSGSEARRHGGTKGKKSEWRERLQKFTLGVKMGNLGVPGGGKGLRMAAMAGGGWRSGDDLLAGFRYPEELPRPGRGILVRSSYILISIRDPDKRKVRVPKQLGLRDVLHLAFHDAELADNMTLPEDITLMTEKHARQVWSFVKKWENEVGTVVVHCEQGMSRSPAIAAALCKRLGGDESRYFKHYQPNQHVYRLMLDPAPDP